MGARQSDIRGDTKGAETFRRILKDFFGDKVKGNIFSENVFRTCLSKGMRPPWADTTRSLVSRIRDL